MFRHLAVSATTLALILGCASAQEQPAPEVQQIEGIIAVVNDDPISFSDVRQRARMLLLSLGGQQPTQEQVHVLLRKR